MHTISFRMTHDVLPAAPIQGFRFIWAFQVDGHDHTRHCQPGLKGRRVSDFCTPTARSGVEIACAHMDRFPYLYLCGVASGRLVDRGVNNMHLPLRHAPGEVVEYTSYNGYHFRAEHAALVAVPELPDGFAGLPRAHHRCRNFQFAVSVFGFPPSPEL